MPEKLTLTKWNNLIEQINTLLDECGELQLEDIEGPTKWYKGFKDGKASVRELQQKLELVCDQNEFEDIPDKWKQSIIDELEEAIASGACCCDEDLERTGTPDFIGNMFHVEKNISGVPNGTGHNYQIWDWAGWIGKAYQSRSTLTLTCEDESTREIYSGGFGYGPAIPSTKGIISGFNKSINAHKSWQFIPKSTLAGELGPAASGSIIDNYVQLPGVLWAPQQSCDTSPGSGTPLGEEPPGWTPPFSMESRDIGAQTEYRLTDGKGVMSTWQDASMWIDLGSSFSFLSFGGSFGAIAVLQSTSEFVNGSLTEFIPHDPLIGIARFFC